MITAILLMLLGTALLSVLMAMMRAPTGVPSMPLPAAQPPQPIAHSADPLEVDAWDAKPGDYLSIEGGAEDYSDFDFSVISRSAYEASNHRWVALSGDFRGRPIRLEVYRYPQPQVIGFLDNRRLTLADLGLTEDQLADLDTRQDPNATINYNSKTWRYESSREIGYCENEQGAAEGLYRWMFTELDGPGRLCIEKREGEPFDVRIARLIDSRDISIYRA